MFTFCNMCDCSISNLKATGTIYSRRLFIISPFAFYCIKASGVLTKDTCIEAS